MEIEAQDYNIELITVLKNQINYYFSDENLAKDTFLQSELKKDKKRFIPISILNNFNMIKSIFKTYNITGKQARKKILISVIENSDKFKLDKFKNKFKLKKRPNFKLLKNKIEELDKNTIYVENIPNHISLEILKLKFLEYGDIANINLPSYINSINKEYSFITYKNEDSIYSAIKNLNNSICNEFMEGANHYVKPLRIITKSEWNEYYKKFQTIKNELNIMKKVQDNSSISKINYKTNKILRLTFMSNCSNSLNTINKEYLEIIFLQFNTIPLYTDYNNKLKECYLRFKSKHDLNNFISEFNSKKNYFFNITVNIYVFNIKENHDYLSKLKK